MEITAHRGASGLAPENTIAAIEKALEAGVDFIEIDLQITRDGRLILLHDPDFIRTGNLNLKIWEADYRQVKTIDVGSWFSQSYSDQRPPLLEDIFDMIKGRCRLNLEIKYNGRNSGIVEATGNAVAKAGMEDHVIITSFNRSFIRASRILFPAIKTGYVFSLPVKPYIWLNTHPVASMNKIALKEGVVKLLKYKKKEIHVWTLDNEYEIDLALKLKVDNIITNRPDFVNKFIYKKDNYDIRV